MTGHQHSYERLALLGPKRPARSERTSVFLVGTGGAGLANLGSPKMESEVQNCTPLATIAVTSYSETTAAPLTTYTYQVRARDAAGTFRR
jgi:hypothetical protein